MPVFYGAVVIGTISAALSKTPSAPSDSNWASGAFDASGRNLTIRSPISPWQIVLGRCRVGGVLAFAHITADKQYFHMVILLAAHASDAIEAVYLNDEAIAIDGLDANGNVVTSDTYVRDDSRPLSFTGTISGTSVTVDEAIESVSYSVVNILDDENPAYQELAVLSWVNNVFTVEDGHDGKTCIIHYTSSASTPLARIRYSLGDEAYSDAGGTQPFPDLVTESGGAWSSTDRWDGHTKLWIRLDKSAVQGGFPQVSAVIRGKTLYDSRSGTTAYKNNAALAVADYFTDTEYGLGADFADELDVATLEVAAASCDDDVPLAAGGTERRYTVNGIYRTSERPGEILEKLLGAMAGRAVHASDRWYVYAGAYTAPTVTLTDDELAGGVTINPLPDRESWCNVVRGVFMNPATWQADDFPPIVSDTYIADDGGEEIAANLDLSSFVASATQAQRLAKIHLFRSRNAMTHEANWRLSAYRALTGCNVAVDSDRYGWSGQVFQLASSQFVVTQGEGGAPALGVRHTLVQDASEFYDWSTSEEGTLATAATTNLPSLSTPPDAPGITSITEALYVTADSSGVKSKATVTWGVTAEDPYFLRYELYYKAFTDSEYRSIRTSATSAEVLDLEPGVHLFYVRQVNQLERGTNSAVAIKDIIGRTAAPSDPTGFAVQSYGGQARFTWDRPSADSDLDVILGGRALIRWTPVTSGAVWEDGSLVNPDGFPAAACRGDGPLLTGTYMLKFRDPPESGGKYSATMASFVVTAATLATLTGVTTVTESSTFSGTKSNVAVVDGALQLVSDVLWDSLTTNMDSWGYVDSEGGIAASGSYTFANTLDTGSVGSYRLDANIVSSAFDANDLWDSRTDLMDDWGLVDGGAIEDAEVKLMVRVSNDNVTYGSWHDMGLSAEYSMRYAQFRLDFTSDNATHNRRVTTLAVSAKH